MKKLMQMVMVAMACLGGLYRVNMEVSLYQMQEQLATLNNELRQVKNKIGEDAGKAGVKMEDLRQLKGRADELTERRDLLQARVAEMEEAARARLENGEGAGGARMSREEARGRFFQAVLSGQGARSLPKMVYEQLGAIPADNADQGTGSNLLPTQMGNELLMEPLVDNPLRGYMSITQITGLELPKLGFSVDDDDFMAKDGATAKELKLKGDKVSFGNNKMMLRAAVSESVLRASPVNIDAAVSAGLQSGQAAKELKVLFATAPAATEAHMSLYSTANAIKEVEGTTLLDAIMAAYADLEDAYVANAAVVMTRGSYIGMIRSLANSAESLYGKKPEEIIGIPVIFCSKATQPVVGDFRFLHLNYNAPSLYDTDKDVKVGNRDFVLTHWYDIRVKLSSAFRRAKVSAVSP